MALILPDPPPNSCFVIDSDAQGRPRLNWCRPLRPTNYVAMLLVTSVAGGGLLYMINLLTQDIAALLAGGVAAGGIFVLDLLMASFLAFFVLMASFLAFFAFIIVMACVRDLIHGPTSRRISFGADALTFEPALLDPRGGGRVERVSRRELGVIRLYDMAGRPRLTFDFGVRRIEFGRDLTDPERAWLAGVVNEWGRRGGAGSADTLNPPPGSHISVEGEPGAWRLSWQPTGNAGTRTLMRWTLLAGLAHWLVAWVALTVFFKVCCGGALIRQLVRGDWLALILLAVLTLGMIAWMTPARDAVRNIRRLLARPRPESLTLGSATLTHDPGNLVRGLGGPRSIQAGPSCEIPLSAIDDILWPGEGPVVLVHGQEKRQIAGCLSEPEREWLAQVLRTWAGKVGPPVAFPTTTETAAGGASR